MRLPPKKQQPRRGIAECLSDQPSAAFVTLQLGRAGISRLQSRPNESLVSWLVECAINNTQVCGNVKHERKQRHKDEVDPEEASAAEKARHAPHLQAQASVRRLEVLSAEASRRSQPRKVSRHR